MMARENFRVVCAPRTQLKKYSVRSPRQNCVITGLSGSGKRSLAFDTIFVKAAKYVESLSAFGRQSGADEQSGCGNHWLSPMFPRPKSQSHNPRSTVGTVTEVYGFTCVCCLPAGLPPLSKSAAASSKSNPPRKSWRTSKSWVRISASNPFPLVRNEKHLSGCFDEIRKAGLSVVRFDGERIA